MKGQETTTLVDDEGNVREVTDADLARGVRVSDFASLDDAIDAARAKRDAGRSVVLEPDVLAHFAAEPDRMNERVNALLRQAIAAE